MGRQEKLCQCHANGCIKHPVTDRDTRQTTLGVYLSPKVYARHQKEEAVFLGRQALEQEQRALEEAVFASSDQSVDRNDPATSSRSHYRYTPSQSASNPNQALSQPVDGAVNAPSSHLSASPPIPDERSTASRLQEIEQHRQDFQTRKRSFRIPPDLVFDDRHSDSHTIPPLRWTTSGDTERFLRHQDWVQKMVEVLDGISSEGAEAVGQARKSFIRELQEYAEDLDGAVAEQWQHRKARATVVEILQASSTQSLAGSTPVVVNTDSHFHLRDILADGTGPILGSAFVAVALNLFAGLNRVGCEFVLVAMQIVVVYTCWSLRFSQDGVDTHASSFMDVENWPRRLSTAYQFFNLDPELVKYATCPSCCCTYAPTTALDGVVIYPSVCSFKETPESAPCHTALLVKREASGMVPIRPFYFQPFTSWLARILSLPGMEDLLDRPKKFSASAIPSILKDIWDGSVLRDFKGSDGRSFSVGPPGEARLVFSLYVDWFNPFGNKISGKKNSLGAIYMICLNLPSHLRYKIENVYIVGIIPGPHEPSLQQMNHFLRPLVDELLRLWNPGVFFSRTASYSLGRRVRCAIVPLVADVQALRKTAGFSAAGSSFFCSFCQLLKVNILNFKVPEWPRRSWARHLQLASEWKNALNEKARALHWDQHHIRWSELLRLPYWDPTRFAVLDSMHNLFLGDIQTHFREIWDLDKAPSRRRNKNQEKMLPHTSEEQAACLHRGITAIREGNDRPLKQLRLGYVTAIALVNRVAVYGPHKKHYIEALLDWHQKHPSIEIVTPPTSPEPTTDLAASLHLDSDTAKRSYDSVLTAEVMAEVWADMKETTLPSWMTRPPRNFGSPGHGKLTADQWRTVCTVNMTITLVRLFTSAAASAFQRAALENYLALVIAVRVATMRSTSEERIQLFEKSFAYYLTTLVTVYALKASDIHPNHHLSLHLPECLRAFGPVHAWWSFPFERFNGALQRIKTNSKAGEIELSMMSAFCRAANMRHLLRLDGLPELMKRLKTAVLDKFAAGFRGTLMNDIISLGEEDAKNETPSITTGIEDRLEDNSALYQQFLDCLNRGSPGISYVPHTHQAVTVTPNLRVTSGKSYRDSLVLFRFAGDVIPGQISKIFTHCYPGPGGDAVTEIFLAILQFAPLTDEEAVHDPYRKQLHLECALYHKQPSSLIVIRSSDLISHFASCPYRGDPKYRVVMSLDRT